MSLIDPGTEPSGNDKFFDFLQEVRRKGRKDRREEGGMGQVVLGGGVVCSVLVIATT